MLGLNSISHSLCSFNCRKWASFWALCHLTMCFCTWDVVSARSTSIHSSSTLSETEMDFLALILERYAGFSGLVGIFLQTCLVLFELFLQNELLHSYVQEGQCIPH